LTHSLTVHHNKRTCLYRTTPSLQHIFNNLAQQIQTYLRHIINYSHRTRIKQIHHNLTAHHPKQHSKPRQKSVYLSTAQQHTNHSRTKYKPTSNSPCSRHTCQPQLRTNLQTHHENRTHTCLTSRLNPPVTSIPGPPNRERKTKPATTSTNIPRRPPT
jgi:hypothetical protein